MNKHLTKRLFCLTSYIIILSIAIVPSTAFASDSLNTDSIDTVENQSALNADFEKSSNFYIDLLNNDLYENFVYDESFGSGEDGLVLKSIGNIYISASRPSSKKANYNVKAIITPKADVTVKIQKCTYNSSLKKWVASGAGKTKNYVNTGQVNTSGSFTINASTTYKIKATIVEKRSSGTNTKIALSKAI